MQFNVQKILKEFQHLPKFEDGRIDYSNVSKAPVLLCFVRFQNKILLVKRSNKVGNYQGKWNVVAGFIDEPKPLKDKVLEELQEELGIQDEQIDVMLFRDSYEVHDKNVNKTWIVYPVIVEMKNKPEITLDWEHTEFVWITPEEIKNYDTIVQYEEAKKVLED